MDVDTSQPLGTPTWIDLGVPDLDRAQEFYGAVFGWEFAVGPAEYGRYTTCLLRGPGCGGALSRLRTRERPRLAGLSGDAGLRRHHGARARRPAATVLVEPHRRPGAGADGLRARPGGRRVRAVAGRGAHRVPGGERARVPGAQRPGHPRSRARPRVLRARLRLHPRRQPGHAPGRLHLPAPPRRTRGRRHHGRARAASRRGPPPSRSPDTDEAVRRAIDTGGSSDGAKDFRYGRLATITDPFGAEFSIITRPEG